jgi:heterodisulfide reductase subunit A-like polyferredoxin
MAKMTEQEMQELADKLIKMKVNKARGYTRRLDADVVVQMMRVGVGHEILTRYRLPNRGVVVTLVEEEHTKPAGGNGDKLKAVPAFVEARVEPLG